MIRVFDASTDDVGQVLRQRELQQNDSAGHVVSRIIEDVRRRGDAAVLDSARQYDCPDLETCRWTGTEPGPLPEEWEAALQFSIQRVRAFHEQQLEIFSSSLTRQRWQMPSETVGQRVLPLQSVGVYVPGGKAAYPSSVIMNAVPAQVAGVERIVVASPAQACGSWPAPISSVACKLNISEGILAGGAAAIAAMALGTETIPRVDKIVGPGNRFVNEAKRQLWGKVGLDGYAGPSEVAVLADDSANPILAAADFLTQIEHAEDNAGFLICLTPEMLRQILGEVDRLATGSRREKILRAAMASEGAAIVATSLSHACDLINEIAPEHLTLMVSDPEAALSRIRNAGCVLMGANTPESAADWTIGPSHTLPTAGGARFGSPVNVLDFLKIQSIAHLDGSQLAQMLPAIEAFGEMEGFAMHALACRLRTSES